VGGRPKGGRGASPLVRKRRAICHDPADKKKKQHLSLGRKKQGGRQGEAGEKTKRKKGVSRGEGIGNYLGTGGRPGNDSLVRTRSWRGNWETPKGKKNGRGRENEIEF